MYISPAEIGTSPSATGPPKYISERSTVAGRAATTRQQPWPVNVGFGAVGNTISRVVELMPSAPTSRSYRPACASVNVTSTPASSCSIRSTRTPSRTFTPAARTRFDRISCRAGRKMPPVDSIGSGFSGTGSSNCISPATFLPRRPALTNPRSRISSRTPRSSNARSEMPVTRDAGAIRRANSDRRRSARRRLTRAQRKRGCHAGNSTADDARACDQTGTFQRPGSGLLSANGTFPGMMRPVPH